MNTNNYLALLFGLMLAVSGCSTLVPHIEEPKVSVTGVAFDKSFSGAGFTTQLAISNPNNFPLNITGFYYELKIDSYEVANGTNNKAMNLPAYGTIDTDFYTKINLLESLSLINALSKRDTKAPLYELKAKLQVNGFPIPITISKKGELTLN